MSRALPLTAVAALVLAACSTTPGPTYYAAGAPPVPVAGSSAAYSAGTGTVAGGVNTFSTGDRVMVGEPASRTTTTGDAGSAASTTVIGGSAMNPSPNAGTPSPAAHPTAPASVTAPPPAR